MRSFRARRCRMLVPTQRAASPCPTANSCRTPSFTASTRRSPSRSPHEIARRIQLMQPITLRWVPAALDIPADLWAASLPPPVEGDWWYRALEDARLEDQFRFAYGVLEREQQPIGIVPTFQMDVPIDLVAPPLVAAALRVGGRIVQRLASQRTLFVGSPCSDEGTIGLVRGEPLGPVLDVVQ